VSRASRCDACGGLVGPQDVAEKRPLADVLRDACDALEEVGCEPHGHRVD